MPSYEEVCADKRAFVAMTRLIHRHSDPEGARRLVQFHGREAVVVNPPAWPLTEAEMDRIYGLPFTRRPHPGYGRQRIPAYEVVKDSIQILRGCFGGCTFCSLAMHQGRIIQSRSRQSVLEEIGRMAGEPEFSGVVSDLGGPTANMYQMNCTRPEVRRRCRRPSCLVPTICALLGTDHGPLVELMRSARRQDGVKQVFVASGRPHGPGPAEPRVHRGVGPASHGRAAEGGAGTHRPGDPAADAEAAHRDASRAFSRSFCQAAAAAGKEQYLVPYFMAGHPGCDLPAMIDLALYLKRRGLSARPGAGFHPPAHGRGHLHVLHGDRSHERPRGLCAQGRPDAAVAAGAFAVFQAGELRRGPRGPARGRPRGLDRPAGGVPDRSRVRHGESENKMFTPDQYQLLDFGEGRRLERFGEVTLDRPCPAAEQIARADPAAWPLADARFDRGEAPEGQWTCRRELPEQWTRRARAAACWS